MTQPNQPNQPLPPPLPAPFLVAARRLADHIRGRGTDCLPEVYEERVRDYLDPEVLEQERQLLARSPQILALEADLRGPEVGAVPVQGAELSALITTDAAGEQACFHNVCPHRGAPLATAPVGGAAIACPFHGWSWSLDGSPRRRPCSAAFATLAPERTRLQTLSHRVEAGLVRIGVDAATTGFHEPLATELAALELGRFRRVGTKTHTVAANWKLAFASFAESYHFPALHSKTVSRTVDSSAAWALAGPDARMLLRRRGELGGPDPELGELDDYVLVYLLFPNSILVYGEGRVELFVVRPGQTPAEAIVEHGYYVAEDDPGQTAAHLDRFEQVAWVVEHEDFAMLEAIQARVRQQGDSSWFIGRNEIGVQHFLRTLARARADASSAGGPGGD